jgi:hypothetical protein
VKTYLAQAGLALALAVGAGGCTTLPGGGAVETANAGSGTANVQRPDGQPLDEVTVPPNVMTIPGLPVPAGAEVVLGDTVLVGQDDTWTGQVVLVSRDFRPVQITEFMRQAMPNYGWEETAIVRSRRTSITFVQGDRFATVRIMSRETGTEMDIVVAPDDAPS